MRGTWSSPEHSNFKSAVVKKEAPTYPEKLAIGMDQDTRYRQIYAEGKQKAAKFYQNVEETGRGLLTLQMDTERKFRRLYPEDAKRARRKRKDQNI